MQKQVNEDEEMILDKAEYKQLQSKRSQKPQQQMKQITHGFEDIEVEQNIQIDDPNELKLANMIDWSQSTIIQQNDLFIVEEAPIQDQLNKILTIIRIQKPTGTEQTSAYLLFEETKKNFTLIKDNYQKFNNVPIIFDIKEVNNSQLVIVVQHFQRVVNLLTKYSSIEYMKWQYDNAKDLLSFSELGITFDSGPLHNTSFVQTRMNNFLFNPLIFIATEPFKNNFQNGNKGRDTSIEMEEDFMQEYKRDNKKTKSQQAKFSQGMNDSFSSSNEGKNEVEAQNIILKSIFSCLSIMLQRNIFENDLMKKKNQNLERLIMSLINEILDNEKRDYVNLTMKDFENNKKWDLLQLKKKKKGKSKRSKSSSDSKSSNNSQFEEEWEELKLETEQQARNNFKSQNQKLFDLIISVYAASVNLQSSHMLLKESYNKEKTLKMKCMISLSDERNVKKLSQLLSQKKQKSTEEEGDNEKQRDQQKEQKEKEKEDDDNDDDNNLKEQHKNRSPQKLKKSIKKNGKESPPILENKRIKINDVKRKEIIPKNIGGLYRKIIYAKNKQLLEAHRKNQMTKETQKEDEEVLEIQETQNVYKIHTIKFSFSIYSESKEISQLYKTLKPYKNNLTSITLIYSMISINSTLLKKYIIPVLSYPNLLYMRLHLNGCFQSNPIFWEKEDIYEDNEDEDEEEDNDRKVSPKNQNEIQEKIKDIIEDLVERGHNPNLEFFEIHLEKNYTRDEDIDILFGFIKGAFQNLSRLEIGWQDAYIQESQVTRMLKHLSLFKDDLNQIGLTLWKNARIGDDQVKEICDCLSQFTKLGLVTLGLLECRVSNDVGYILRDFLNSLPFLLVLEIGLDDNHLNSALGVIGESLKTQKLLKYIGMSFQDSYLNDDSFSKFSEGMKEMYNLEDLHFFVGKNSITSESAVQFFNTISPYSKQLQILDLGFQKNNLSQPEFIDSLCKFLKDQESLIKIELCFDSTKLKGSGIAQILNSINREQQLEVIHLNMQSCSLNTEGFTSISDLLHQLKHPEVLTLLRICVPHNVMNLNEEQQAILGMAIKRYTNLIELDLDFSGCHLYNEFFSALSQSVSSLHNLEFYTLVLHKCFLSQYRMKCIIEGLKNKNKLKDLSLELQDCEIPMIDQIYDPNVLLTSVEIFMPEIKQLSLNFLRCGWSFKLVILLLVQIGSINNKNKPLANFNSLNVYVCNQQLEEQMLYHFKSVVNNLYKNALELTITFDDCDLDYEKCTVLFDLTFTQLRNIDISISDNIEINMQDLSVFIAKQTFLQYLGLKLKQIQQPVRDFGCIGHVIKYLNLKVFSLYFEQSKLIQPRSLELFYNGLAAQKNIETIILHLHNIDHSTNQIKQFAQKLLIMDKLVSLNLHLPNSMLRKEEINQLSISIGNKPYLKELILEFYKNEIIYKNGAFFARSIASLKNLQKLDFSLMRCEILPCTAEKLCFSVGELKLLNKLHLYLGENSINSFTLVFLAYSLYNLKNIINFKINLADTTIGDEGIESLAKGLLNLKNIIFLDLNLENTDLEQESLILLGRYFRENSQNLQTLEMNLRNNTQITENGFRGLMEGIGEAKGLTQIVIMMNQCVFNTQISSHLPLMLNQKKKLKVLQLYFDENLLLPASAKILGMALKTNCPKVKRLTLCVQLNQLSNNGVNDLMDGIFSMPELQKATIDLRQNEINNKTTLVKMGATISKSKKIKDLELLLFENQEFNDNQISKGLYALAQSQIDLFDQLVSFDIRNQYWKDNIKNTIIPISMKMICHMQIIAFQNYLSPILHYNGKFTIWDLYLP